jgi:hypothetical protein
MSDINTDIIQKTAEVSKSSAMPCYMSSSSIVGTSKGRSAHDFYPTPPLATESLLEKEQFSGTVFEPACGEGAISKILVGQGFNVTSSDLIDRGYGATGVDFLSFAGLKYDNIITNPPYCLAERFLEVALETANHKVAFLLKLAFLEGIKRQKIFLATPIARVYVFSKRLSFYRDGKKTKNSGMMAFAWFVWEKKYNGSVMVNWI